MKTKTTIPLLLIAVTAVGFSYGGYRAGSYVQEQAGAKQHRETNIALGCGMYDPKTGHYIDVERSGPLGNEADKVADKARKPAGKKRP